MAVNYKDLKNGGFMRQKQKDNFSLRLQVVGGNMTANQLKTVAEVAEKYAHGYVHFTSRQSVEIPFIQLNDIDNVVDDLAKGDCKPGACGPRVRTITACQGNQICASGNIDTYDIAKKLDERYYGRNLPHKFKFGVTGCQNNCLKTEENDIGIKGACVVSYDKEKCIGCGLCAKVCRFGAIAMNGKEVVLDKSKCTACGRCEKACPKGAMQGESAYAVSFGGLFGNRIHKGEQLLPLIHSEEQLFRVTDAALDFFNEHAKAGERFQFTLERVGLDKFQKVIEDAYKGE